MRTLRVGNFSCIASAELEVGRLTTIIGPQASGKSVLAKLCFFANDIVHTLPESIGRGDSFDKMSLGVKKRFMEWFPVAAWGTKKFRIQYSAGEYSVTFSRKTYRDKLGDDFRIRFSPEFRSAHESMLKRAERSAGGDKDRGGAADFDREWRLRNQIRAAVARLQGEDAVSFQMFVPAGRSFFTSIGKAIAAFEQGGVLDPLILRFGHMYARFMDRRSRGFFLDPSTRRLVVANDQAMSLLLGGVVRRDDGREFLLTPDGRQVPLSTLSSGQQELLPIVACMPSLYNSQAGTLHYVEEPEAHLFPSTQCKIMQALVEASYDSSLIITTHSPYVLAKVNNLIKAGELGARPGRARRAELSALVPKRAWLKRKNVRAYALVNGHLTSILGSDGLVDAAYIDTCSSELASEFEALLRIEESGVH